MIRAMITPVKPHKKVIQATFERLSSEKPAFSSDSEICFISTLVALAAVGFPVMLTEEPGVEQVPARLSGRLASQMIAVHSCGRFA